MSKKSTALSPLKRPSTRSLSTTKLQPNSAQHKAKDKYTFQSDDEDHQTKPVLVRKTVTPALNKRARGRPPKTPKQEGTPLRASLSSSNLESDSSIEEGSAIKRKPSGEKVQTPKKRPRKTKMSTTTDIDPESDKSKQQMETENIVPANAVKRRSIKKKTLSTDTNPKSDVNEHDDQNIKLSSVDEKELMQFGSPQHSTQQTPNATAIQTHQSDDEFSDDSVEFVWKGSSKLSIEILKRRIPKDEPKDQLSASQADPTAQRKRAIIPRLTNFDALSGQPAEQSFTASTPMPAANKRVNQADNEANLAKKSSSVITLNNVFQNDFVPSYNDAGTKMTTTTTAPNTTDEKPRPRIYAVKSTTMKARQPPQPEIKRPKWMNDQQGKSEEEEEEDVLAPAGEEPDDFDYVPKGQYIPKRPNFRGRGTYPARRGTGMRGRPPGSRRQWHDDDDDDDYDQYEDTHSRYGPRKQTAYRSSRPTYDMADDNGDYDRNRRMSLTQAYRRNNSVRPPLGSMSGQRRIAINNGNQPIYKDEDYYHQQQPTQTRTSSSSTTTVPTAAATTANSNNASGQAYVTKMNDHQLNDVSNQSQIFFVNVPQQEQKTQQQVLSVLTADQQQQQQVLPVTVVQQVKLPMDAPKQKKILPKPSANNSQLNSSNESSSNASNKPFAWSRPPGRIPMAGEEQTNNKGSHSSQANTDLDTMEAAHVLATAADVTMAADARRKAQQHDDDIHMIVEETPSTIVSEETIQCDNDPSKLLAQQQFGTITANIIDENGVEHTVYLSPEEAQQLLGSQGAIIVDSDGQPISIQQAPPPPPQTFVSPFALDQAQLQALLAQAGIDPNTPLTIEQVDPNQVHQGQQQQVATLCTSPGGTQYTVLTQGPAQQQFILQTAASEPATSQLQVIQQAPAPTQVTTQPVAIQPQPIAPKEETSSPPPKRRAFAVKSTTAASRPDAFEDINANDRPRRKIFATKSTVTAMNEEMSHDEEGIIGTRAYHRNVTRK